jgi:hypothetical protein
LHTHSQSSYYTQLGWKVLERFEAWGKSNTYVTAFIVKAGFKFVPLFISNKTVI